MPMTLVPAPCIRKKLRKLVRPSDALNRFVKALHVKVSKMVEFSQTYPSGITYATFKPTWTFKEHAKNAVEIAIEQDVNLTTVMSIAVGICFTGEPMQLECVLVQVTHRTL